VSLIEQAAKRLEQLQKAGVELPVPPAADTRPVEPARGTPTPEAVVEELESRLGTTLDAQFRKPDLARAPEPEPEVTAKAEGRPARQRVDIDLIRLAAQGYVTPDEAISQLANEFRLIKRPLLDNVIGRSAAPVARANVIMVTSAMSGEGKTFTSLNLAMSMAMEVDHTVLLVDADVTRPSVMARLGLAESKGLMDALLAPAIPVEDLILETNVERLTLLPAGSGHERATELLASAGMAGLVRDLATRYPDRIVIFDAPPLLATTESRVLATHMGQVVVVVEADRTTHGTLTDALDAVKSCPVVCTVLNKARQSDLGNYGYYGYGSRSGSGDRKSKGA
jgi:receptor protein-tyrosine kinase